MSATKFTRNSNGRISAPNLSAYWIPELTITEVIKGSVYTISGEYVGTECIVPKLKRIMAHDVEELIKEASPTTDDLKDDEDETVEGIEKTSQEREEDLHDKSAE